MLALPQLSSAGSRPMKARWEWVQLLSDPSVTPQPATRSPPSSNGLRTQVEWHQINVTYEASFTDVLLSTRMQNCNFQMFSINYHVFHVSALLIGSGNTQWGHSIAQSNGFEVFLKVMLCFFTSPIPSFSCSSFEPKFSLEQFVIDLIWRVIFF